LVSGERIGRIPQPHWANIINLDMNSVIPFLGTRKSYNGDDVLLLNKRTRREAGMLTPAQLRAARALVGWSRDELAEKSGVAAETVKRFEFRGSDPKLGTVNKWRRALEAAGVEFIEENDASGSGVRWKKGWPKAKR